MTKAQALGGPDVRSGAVPRNVPQSVGVSSSGLSAQPLRQGPVTMPGADRGPRAPQSNPVERALAPVTEPVTQAPKTVVGAIGEKLVPNGRGLAQTGSLTARVIPDEVVPPVQEEAQPAMAMLSPLSLG